MDSTKLFKLIYHFKTRRPKVGLKCTVYIPWYTSILHIINEMGNVVKASEEDRRESLKSTTISFEDADERVKKGTFMEFFLDARRSLPGVVKCIHKFTLSKTEMEGRFLQFRIK